MDEVKVFEAHDSYVLGLQFTGDGGTLISAGMDNVLKLWSTNDWQAYKSIKGHDNSVHSFSLSGDERLLATGSTDQTVRLWSFPGGDLLHTLQDRKKTVAAVQISPDGQYVAAASYGGRLAVWTLEGEEVMGVRVSKKNLASVAWSPDGQSLAASGLGDTVTLWAFPSGEMIGELVGHEVAVGSLVFLDGGKSLLSFGYEKRAIIWDVEAGTILRQFFVEGKDARGATLSPDQSLAAVNLESLVKVYRLPDWSLEAELPVSTKVASAVAFSSDNKTLAVGGADKKIRIWQA